MMPTIERLTALEILDSRGRPTVQATCSLSSGAQGTASVPSGASTGAAEALELRDGDLARYGGLGCRKAVANVNGEINAALKNHAFDHQHDLDHALIDLDGTTNKARVGANAILAVSLAFARAASVEWDIPLYQYFAAMIGQPLRTLPRPMINLFSGGKHAGGQVDLQDIQVMPLAARTIDEVLAATYAVFQAAAKHMQQHYNMRLLTADEGGLAPPFPNADALFEAAVEAIRTAGLRPGEEVTLTLDAAASHFYKEGRYHLGAEVLDSPAMVDRLVAWLDRYPLVSLEDGLAEEDWQGWQSLYKRAAHRALIVGDDLLCTNPARIRKAVDLRAANTLLLKVNQIGTLTEAAEAYLLAKSAGWKVIASARSGETEDDWLADLAVGWGADHLKVGSITQSERLAKYNRLLAIEQATGLALA
jgi:enolase